MRGPGLTAHIPTSHLGGEAFGFRSLLLLILLLAGCCVLRQNILPSHAPHLLEGRRVMIFMVQSVRVTPA